MEPTMIARIREARLEILRLDMEALREEWVNENSPMCGCSCQDYEGKADGRLCPQCGQPLRDYDRATMLEIASV
jgi:hypothetical protein